MRVGKAVVGGLTDRRVALAGELKHPITFMRSTRTPDDTTGFNQQFQRVGRAWAKVEWGEEKRVDGENPDRTYTHLFTIRYAGWLPEQRDKICHGSQLYSIEAFRIVGGANDFLRIKANAWAATNGQPLTTTDAPAEEGGEPTHPVTIAAPVAQTEITGTRYEQDFWDAEDTP